MVSNCFNTYLPFPVEEEEQAALNRFESIF